MSNPPTPLQLKLLRGNPGRRPIRSEPEPARETQCPEPPEFIGAYAKDEWWRTAPELHRLGLLTVLDVAPLAVYCQAYCRWREAEEVLAVMRDRDAVTRGLVIKSADGNPRRNPLVKIADDAADAMTSTAGHFGLTPVARSRLAAGVHRQPGPSKFGDLLGG